MGDGKDGAKGAGGEEEQLPGETARMSRAYLDKLIAKKLADKAEEEAGAEAEAAEDADEPDAG